MGLPEYSYDFVVDRVVARYYDATIGRFISADTIVPEWGNPQALNRYSYCRNNPLLRVDPSGHDDLLDRILPWNWGSSGGGKIDASPRAAAEMPQNVKNLVVDVGEFLVSEEGQKAIIIVGAVTLVVVAPQIGLTAVLIGSAGGAGGHVMGTAIVNTKNGAPILEGLSGWDVAEAAVIGGTTTGLGTTITTTNALANFGKGVVIAEVNANATYLVNVAQGEAEFSGNTMAKVNTAGLLSGSMGGSMGLVSQGITTQGGSSILSQLVTMPNSAVAIASSSFVQQSVTSHTSNVGYYGQGAWDYMNSSAETHGYLF